MSRRVPRTSAAAPPTTPVWPTPWVPAILLVSLFLALAAWSWRRGGDVFIDFGHELYVPWQLSQGRVLYRDIAYFMGPLSQYFNATMFAVFGVSLTTLVLVNLSILAGITAAIYSLFSRALGRHAALLAAAVFLCLFGFAHYNRVGNYNYVTPYLHEQTHGVALALLLLVLLERLTRRTDPILVGSAGAALGLVFLTKAEAFLPAAACTLVAAVLLCRRHRPAGRRAAALAGLFAAGVMAPISVAFAFLAVQMPASMAARGVAGNWVYVLDRELVVADPFYASGLGLDAWTAHVRDILGATAGVLAFALVALALERILARRERGAVMAVGVLVGVALAIVTDAGTWSRSARVLPVVCTGAVLVFLRLAWRAREEADFRREFLLALWSVWSLASLGKMILKARLDHYGFALAMPGVILAVMVTVFVVPSRLRAGGGSGEVWRAASLAAVAVGTLLMLRVSHLHYRTKTLAVGAGGDLLHAIAPRLLPDSAHFVAAVDLLRDQMRPGSTLAVLPDGALINYLLRAANPTPYYLVTPWEMRAFGGEDAVFRGIASNPPDYFVLANLDMSEYGPRHFGFDPRYGLRLRLWLEQNYEPLADVGDIDETGRAWLRIYRRPEGHLAQHLPDGD